MKKLLMKWFPSYFNVHVENIIDISTYPKENNHLRLVEVDPGNEHTHESLGIGDERLHTLIRETKKAVLDSDNTIEAMSKMEKHIKHINEFYMVTIILQRELDRMRNPLSGLLGAIAMGGNGPDSDN